MTKENFIKLSENMSIRITYGMRIVYSKNSKRIAFPSTSRVTILYEDKNVGEMERTGTYFSATPTMPRVILRKNAFREALKNFEFSKETRQEIWKSYLNTLLYEPNQKQKKGGTHGRMDKSKNNSGGECTRELEKNKELVKVK